MKHKEVIMDNTYKLQIIDFAEKCYLTNKAEYKRRGQDDPSKIKQDIYYGKLAEYAVWLTYTDMNQDCTKPDLAIYKGRNKSYSADMIVNNAHNLHVKSQLLQTAKQFGLSWMFQKNDPLVKTPLLSDYVVLCVTLNTNKVRVFEPIKAKDLVKKYKKPKKKQLQSTKLALYGKDIGIEL